MILQNALVFFKNKFQLFDVQITNNQLHLEVIDKNDQEVYDLKSKIITPCFVDNHVHSRIQANDQPSKVNEFLKIARSGGYNHVVLMGNLPTPVDNINNYLATKKMYQNYDNVIQVANLTKNFQGQQTVEFHKLVKYCDVYSDDGNPVLSEKIFKKILLEIKKYDKIALLHEQNCKLDKSICLHDCQYTREHNLQTVNSSYEHELVARDLKLNQSIQARLHFQHISQSKSIDFINQYRKTQPITCEVTPHHLILSCDDIKTDDANYKMNPPLTSNEDRKALIKALNAGQIDAISTDHAPHLPTTKKDLLTGAYGVIGMQHAFACLYTFLVKKSLVKLETIIEHLTTKSSRIIFQMDIGFKKNNNDLLFNIIDLDYQFILDQDLIIGAAKNSPWINQKLNGKVLYCDQLETIRKYVQKTII